jgi:hypothetical protein
MTTAIALTQAALRFWIAYIGIIIFGLAFCTQSKADDTLWLSAGQSVTNSNYPLLKSKSWGVAQDLTWRDWHYRLGYLNEGHKEDEFTLGKRDGIYAQWLGTHWLTPRLATELSAGPYISATTVSNPGQKGYADEYRLNALIGVGVKYRLSPTVKVMGMWQRALWTKIEGRYADTDIFSLWIGYSPRAF